MWVFEVDADGYGKEILWTNRRKRSRKGRKSVSLLCSFRASDLSASELLRAHFGPSYNLYRERPILVLLLVGSGSGSDMDSINGRAGT